MPLYEFECTQCRHRFEKIQSVSDPDPVCPKCGSKVERLLHAPAVQFKGSGWYVTDYAKKGGAGAKSDSKTGEKSDSGKSESKSDSKPSESKTETKSSTPSKE
ncbi:MAG: zinc ribbon domain-containing protein [Acidobacteria bacterium]|nr:zinc ribbon domain-containing protein [Acidobacteriota bacterium]MBV9145278.1 zinc ribbon domain-containing protein [Acidobacteriota bacterium]MBV9436200.1 zinc ribbon domain-containing protein [Acidobacteriota bacterium]